MAGLQRREPPHSFTLPSISKCSRPFSDIRVRQAIDLALNRERFVDEIWGGEAEYNGPIAWPLEYWALPQEELRRAYPYDPERARTLLEEAGYADGFAIKMTLPRGGAHRCDSTSRRQHPSSLRTCRR